jgi:hypothetical protein
LGELNLEIDFKTFNQEPTSNSNLTTQPKNEEIQDTMEKAEPLEMPFKWLPELNPAYLEFDEAFEEEYLLKHEKFNQLLSSKMSHFFEGNF